MTLALHHIDTGGDGTPLVVIHGLLGSADNWRSHIKKWQEQHRVIAVDLRNHGRSPHAPGMGYAAMARDVLALLEALGVARAHVLGHSMGGKVAITLARLAPERLASLIVADVAPQAYGHGHDNELGALRRVRDERPADRRQADALMADFIDQRTTRLFLATNLVRGEDGMTVRVGLDQITEDYASISGEPDGEGAFEGPTLVVRGSRSSYVTDAMLPALREVLPNAELETLEAGHWLHAECPEEFQAAVNGFLARQHD
ncbi:alpha/beta fold hydrolase [Halomonas smyrnensis]|uniref:alpha/beta fold hydrolase n=1 Tax=Halomonas smyrnensis TaxID=720605 RepID=UPI0002FFF8A6|nr:alpha/beta fold hydrolase [Halomonas smyrnensis]